MNELMNESFMVRRHPDNVAWKRAKTPREQLNFPTQILSFLQYHFAALYFNVLLSKLEGIPLQSFLKSQRLK